MSTMTLEAPILLHGLHHPISSRLDAGRVADALGLSLKAFSDAHGLKYRTVHKTPDAAALQPLLSRYHRIISLLERILEDPADVQIWLNTPLPDFADHSPVQMILDGHGQAVRELLEDLLAGLPA